MAAPLAAAAKVVAKKVATDIAADPSVILKYICILVGILFGILALFAMPFYLITHVPSIIVNADPPEKAFEKAQIIKMYQNVITEKNNEFQEWVSDEKEALNCDSYRVSFDFDLSYSQLIAIDTVRYSQDLSKVKANQIRNLIDKVIVKTSRKETYTDQVSYNQTVMDEEGNLVVVEKTKSVTKIRGIISVSTKKFSSVLNDLGFDDVKKMLANNYLITMESVDVEGNFNTYDDIDLSDLKEYPPGDANIPLFVQFDKRWGNESYGLSTIKSGGCGPTSLSMVVVALTNKKITPKDVADWSVDNGHRAEGQGSYWSLMTAGGKYYGLKVEAISRKNPTKIAEELRKGNPIIVAMGPGHFTKAGHFIVLRGIDSDGMVYVNDPASITRSEKAWSLGVICGESSTNGGKNGSPFWVFKK